MDEKYLTWVANLIIRDISPDDLTDWLKILKADPARMAELLKMDLLDKLHDGATELGTVVTFNGTAAEVEFVLDLIKTHFAKEWEAVSQPVAV